MPTTPGCKETQVAGYTITKEVRRVQQEAQEIRSEDRVGKTSTFLNAREDWGAFRNQLKKGSYSVEGLASWLRSIEERLCVNCYFPEWVEKRRAAWIDELKSASTIQEFMALLKEIDSDGMNWEKHELMHAVLDAVDMIPYSEVKENNEKYWEFYLPKKLQEAMTPRALILVLKEIDDMIKDESKIREEDWRKRKEKWTEQCRGVKTWGEAEKLFSTWDDNAVDWRKARNAMEKENTVMEQKSKENQGKRENKRDAADFSSSSSSSKKARKGDSSPQGMLDPLQHNSHMVLSQGEEEGGSNKEPAYPAGQAAASTSKKDLALMAPVSAQAVLLSDAAHSTHPWLSPQSVVATPIGVVSSSRQRDGEELNIANVWNQANALMQGVANELCKSNRCSPRTSLVHAAEAYYRSTIDRFLTLYQRDYILASQLLAHHNVREEEAEELKELKEEQVEVVKRSIAELQAKLEMLRRAFDNPTSFEQQLQIKKVRDEEEAVDWGRPKGTRELDAVYTNLEEQQLLEADLQRSMELKAEVEMIMHRRDCLTQFGNLFGAMEGRGTG
ncbi:hypothetical protein GUITHDRAFT_145695 [Guillardia theta CCMP2712]|uniref:Uncharacterized protein n=1 Tax=Guillardia theta (strain CCMP2712) TaxID=905079 RepID=L1IJV1_GUITC|nr:hypothetical protein GUITHDRAFT_145695 [Guillardia theta CCMP2712]EKX36528.1 hypothetical protein GUITHDRAFT_145695 [Guillardia theta CCMP2712]|eukprot:XP_005823508.1 hypothetical protein GUITHDRAFT_145695 [Guillardia theta CCMP2712]